MRPDKLIGDNGLPHFGVFEDAVSEINTADYVALTPLERPMGRIARAMANKQFEYLGVICDELIFGCALANVGYAAIAFIYVYDPKTRKIWEKTLRAPFGIGVSQSSSPIAGLTVFKQGKNRVEFSYADNPRRKGLKVDLASGLKAEVEFDESAQQFQPMSLCTQAGRRGWVYAHKVAAVPVVGSLQCEFGDYDLDALRACGHHDYSTGFMRRETFWNWACLSARLADDRYIGLNVSCGVNESSYSENCAWLDGQLFPLGQARFNYDWDAPFKPWKVTSACGGIELDFEPEGAHQERMNLWLIKSNFKQIFGRFNGQIRCGDETLEIKNLYGFVEDQYAKW